MERFLATTQSRIVNVHPDEVRAMWLGFLFNFIALTSYYVIKPVRDDIAAAGDAEKLSWMFTGTLVAMLIANALFSAIVARMSRRRFIPIAYRFLILNLALFYVLMRTASPAQAVWVGRAFFVWVSVFNLFVVTVFWSFMSDVFNSEQAKRLFGFVSIGGTLGGIVGGTITASLVRQIGPVNLFIISALLLEGAAWCVRFFPTHFKQGTAEQKQEAERAVGGSIWAGVTHVCSSPYLLGICGFMLVYTITSTFLYFQQADIAGHHFHDRAARTAFFAQLDLSVNAVTIVVQIFLTGRLLKWLGVGVCLAIMPLVTLLGFVSLALMPTIALLAFFQVTRRAMNYAISRPAREVLFTVLKREDKYKAKSLIDTFVYRGGDQIGAWSFPFLRWLGLGLAGISWSAVPLAAGWCVLSLWLGRRQAALAGARATTD